jgi:hypothetical protein
MYLGADSEVKEVVEDRVRLAQTILHVAHLRRQTPTSPYSVYLTCSIYRVTLLAHMQRARNMLQETARHASHP